MSCAADPHAPSQAAAGAEDIEQAALGELLNSFNGYLRICRNGGMPGKLSKKVQAAFEEWTRLYASEAIADVYNKLSELAAIAGKSTSFAERGADDIVFLVSCNADQNGACSSAGCPQKRDREPDRTGRQCPLLEKEAAAGSAGLEPMDEAIALIHEAKTTLGPFSVVSARKPTYANANSAIHKLARALVLLDAERRPPPASETTLSHWEWSDHTAEGLRATVKALVNVADDYPVQARTLRDAISALVAASARADALQAKLDAGTSETALVEAMKRLQNWPIPAGRDADRVDLLALIARMKLYARSALAAHRAQQEGRG